MALTAASEPRQHDVMTPEPITSHQAYRTGPRARLPVVVGVDDTDDSALAVSWAAHEARVRGVPLMVLRGYTWATGDPYLASDDRDIVTQLQKQSDRIAHEAVLNAQRQEPDLEVRCEVAEVHPPDLLTERSEQASLVVVGNRGRGALARAVLGSVSSSVVARARAPVVVVCGPAPLTDGSAHVLVGVKPDETADPVLAFAFAYAELHGLGVHATLCWRATGLADATHLPDRARSWLSEAVAGYGEEYPDVSLTTAVVHADAAQTLIEGSVGSTLLVVGRHGRTRPMGALLGAVSQAVIHHATRPVAIVPVS